MGFDGCVGSSSRVLDVTGAKEMFSLSVSHSKVLLLLDTESMVFSV